MTDWILRHFGFLDTQLVSILVLHNLSKIVGLGSKETLKSVQNGLHFGQKLKQYLASVRTLFHQKLFRHSVQNGLNSQEEKDFICLFAIPSIFNHQVCFYFFRFRI